MCCSAFRATVILVVVMQDAILGFLNRDINLQSIYIYNIIIYNRCSININIYFVHYPSVRNLITGTNYERAVSSWCSPSREKFQILSEAEKYCTNDTNCTMIYDEAGVNKTFLLCTVHNPKITATVNNCTCK